LFNNGDIVLSKKYKNLLQLLAEFFYEEMSPTWKTPQKNKIIKNCENTKAETESHCIRWCSGTIQAKKIIIIIIVLLLHNCMPYHITL